MPLREMSRSRRAFTLPELLVVMGVMGILAYTISLIYFSVLKVHRDYAWSLPPYDNATRAVERLTTELRHAMLIDTYTSDSIVVIMPAKDSNRDNVLTLGPDGYVLSQGDRVAFYLSNQTGALGAEGNCLWKAVKGPSDAIFRPRVKIAEDIHPELNPTDPDTGSPRPIFKYWPDEIRLWGVEIWVTSTASVSGQTRTQTAHSESYLRNL